MTYLVTGCAGFIGARVAELLLQDGHRVVGIDNLNSYYNPVLKDYRLQTLGLHPDFSFAKGGIEDYSFITDVFRSTKFDGVLHIAARAGVRSSIENPEEYFATNSLGTLQVLRAMVEFQVSKIVLASTSSLYAGQAMPFHEDLPVNTPISPYAATKKAAEVMAYTYHHLYNLDVSVVRYFTVFGPAGRPDMMPFRFVHGILNGTPIELYGDGSASRDFTYVDDIARGTIAALRPLGYEILNLGGGKSPISVREIIDFISQEAGREPSIRQLPAQKIDMESTWADISKAKRLLDWQPKISVFDGFARTIAWHQEYQKLYPQFVFSGY